MRLEFCDVAPSFWNRFRKFTVIGSKRVEGIMLPWKGVAYPWPASGPVGATARERGSKISFANILLPAGSSWEAPPNCVVGTPRPAQRPQVPLGEIAEKLPWR